MSAVTPDSKAPGAGHPDRFHLWRRRKDSLARWTIAVGGIGVIAAIGLIFIYLMWVVLPLFVPASVEPRPERFEPSWAGSPPVWLSLEEQREVGLRVSRDGLARFFSVESGEEIAAIELPLQDAPLTRAASDVSGSDLVGVASAAGDVYVLRHSYDMDFSGGVESRTVVPKLELPFGEKPLVSVDGAIVDFTLLDDERELTLAVLEEGGRLSLYRGSKQSSLLSGETSLDGSRKSRSLDIPATTIGMSGDRRWIYIGDSAGRIHRYDLDGLTHRQALEVSQSAVTELTMLLGGVSVLAGDASGVITQAFPVRDENSELQLTSVRRFPRLDGAIERIVPESRRKGFLAVSAGGDLGIYHSTAGKRILEVPLTGVLSGIALSPRSDAVLTEVQGGELRLLDIDNPHPEVSWDTLWGQVWYENYPEPEYVWQSSAANTDFEPKFSLTPLVFGTLKAALYAMLFAVPLALMAAAYSAYFMAPTVREVIKPTIETMAALPTVVLGFLAGLWFAPFVEKHLAGIITVVIVVPAGVVLFAWCWHRYRGRLKDLVPQGWEPLLLVPVVVALVFAAMWLAEPLQSIFFGGDLRSWLSQEAGIDYDQRNALVVGCAMGFAVIPAIFSIAEDAFYGVPRQLSMGSLALGATPWQTMLHVVLPTASPGIFSALMIGLGRAVGETMIVLMATGNTPIMEWNIFEGMRTLAANIAVEMPESAVNSSHYRVLFLAALVLFVFTFIVNTGAEVVRQRLREKYSSL